MPRTLRSAHACIIASAAFLCGIDCRQITHEPAGGGDPDVGGACISSEGQPVALGGVGDWLPDDLVTHDEFSYQVAGGYVSSCGATGATSGRQRCCCSAVETPDGELVEDVAGCGEPAPAALCEGGSAEDQLSCLWEQDLGPVAAGDLTDGALVAGPGGGGGSLSCVNGTLYAVGGAVTFLGVGALWGVAIFEPTPGGEVAAAIATARTLSWIRGVVAIKIVGGWASCLAGFRQVIATAQRAGKKWVGAAVRDVLTRLSSADRDSAEQRVARITGPVQRASAAIEAAIDQCGSPTKREQLERLRRLVASMPNTMRGGGLAPDQLAEQIEALARAIIGGQRCMPNSTLNSLRRALAELMCTFADVMVRIPHRNGGTVQRAYQAAELTASILGFSC